MRLPTAMGFYPPKKEDLDKAVNDLLEKTKQTQRKVLGAVAPHAAYVYSGKTASAVYNAVQRRYDSIIILGVNHTGIGEDLAISTVDWETPLGVVKNDVELGKNIIKNCLMIKEDELAHMYEHSIEVQLPFLQKIFGPDLKIVPICISGRIASLENCEILGEAIKNALTIKKKNALILASSDFTHLGEAYGFMPNGAKKNPLDFIKKTDKEVIDAILSSDTKKAFEKATSTTVCGFGPILTLMFALSGKAKKVTLLDYSTSYETSKHLDMIVGYAGIVFE